MIHFFVLGMLIVLLVVYFVSAILMIRTRRRPGRKIYLLWSVMFGCSVYLIGRRLFGW